jgi:hypothetical protein
MKSINSEISTLPSISKSLDLSEETQSKTTRKRINDYISYKTSQEASMTKEKLETLMKTETFYSDNSKFSFRCLETGSFSKEMNGSKRKFGEAYYSANVSPNNSRFPSILPSPRLPSGKVKKDMVVKSMIRKMIENQLGIIEKNQSISRQQRFRKKKIQKNILKPSEEINFWDEPSFRIDELFIEKIVFRKHEKDWKQKASESHKRNKKRVII